MLNNAGDAFLYDDQCSGALRGSPKAVARAAQFVAAGTPLDFIVLRVSAGAADGQSNQMNGVVCELALDGDASDFNDQWSLTTSLPSS